MLLSDLTAHPIIWTVACGVLALLSLITAISTLFSSSQLKRRLRKWKAIHSTADLEEVYQRTLEEVALVRDQLAATQTELQQIRGILRTKVSTPMVLRYNAFSDLGSDLSYSLALVDDDRNGVVLSSIYGREESRTYAKPVEHGASNYPLTDEELDVLGLRGPTKTRRAAHV